MNLNIDHFRDLAIKAAKEAGRILEDNFGKVREIRSKGDRNLVSNVDLKAEEVIFEIIKKNFPEHSILSEENSQVMTSDYKWIIDPLDGTHNFIKGIPIFGTSIALEYRKEVILGVLYFPLDKRLYWAVRGQGAYLNGTKICVSNRTLNEATVAYDSSIRLQKKNMLLVLDRLSEVVFNLRMFGSTAQSLALIAEGKLDLEIEFNDKPWDFAAGALLVEEAGGKFTDFQGSPWNPYIPNYIASNGIIHNPLIKIIQDSL